MKTEPIRPARITVEEGGLVHAPDFGDFYHAAAGALAQADHVFLRGNGLPERWRERERFIVLETGFGLGNNFLATWDAWRRDAKRCERLVFVSVEKHPLRRDDLALVHAASALPALAQQLVEAWPLLTPNVHALDFEGGRVQLLLAFGDAPAMLRELQLQADALYLDGFAPAKNPAMWSADVFRPLARLCTPGATAATWSAARTVRDELARHGFEVQRARGFADKRDMTVARYAPRYTPPLPAALRPPHQGPREALVIGGGLAGCAAAWGLALQGWQATVLDRQPEPAMETSGNAGGLMHGTFNAPDSLHARWFRTAALQTARAARPGLAGGRVAGQLDGLLRLDPALDDEASLARARAQLDRVGLDPAYLTVLSALDARRCCGIDVPSGGWLYHQAGWLAPRTWGAELLRQAAGHVRWQGGVAVARIERRADAAGRGSWIARDAAGRCVGEAPVLVLAHALGQGALWPAGVPRAPLQALRGQTTVLPASWGHGLTDGAPHLPVSGNGYALHLPDGRLLLGATSQPDDPDPALRRTDHRHNLLRAAGLGLFPANDRLLDAALARADGRVGWRATAPDRLPVVGPPVDVEAMQAQRAAGRRLDALRHRPRWHGADHGLYLLSGLGSRGLTSAALAGRVLAAWISGAPQPVESTLRDALDPARFDPAAPG